MNSATTAPGAVNWTGYLALACLLILPASVFTVRLGAWQPGLLLYAIAILGSLLMLLACGVLLLVPRLAPWRKQIVLNMLFALPGTVLLLSLASGGNSPRIHDITTDTLDPPIFTVAQEQRGSDANSLDIKPDSIAQQRLAYPDLQTLRSPLSPDAAFTRALDVARQLGWQVYHQDRDAGVIEAQDTTRIMAFKDDVVIRLRRDNEGTLVDLRSVSRVGEGDIGANARRINAFLRAFREQG